MIKVYLVRFVWHLNNIIKYTYKIKSIFSTYLLNQFNQINKISIL